MTPLCPPNMLAWYKVVILSAPLSCIAKPADSFQSMVLSLTNKESSNKFLSTEVSVSSHCSFRR